MDHPFTEGEIIADNFDFISVILQYDVPGWTDPMGIRAMPWGPPPKGAHQIFKNNANQERSAAKTAQPSLDNRRNIVMK